MTLPGEEKYHNGGFDLDLDQFSTMVAQKIYDMYQMDFTPVVEAYNQLIETLEALKLRVEVIENAQHNG